MKLCQQIQAILAGNDVHRNRVEPISNQIMKALGGSMATDKQLIQQIVADYYGRCLVCDAPATEDRLCDHHLEQAQTELWRQAELSI